MIQGIGESFKSLTVVLVITLVLAPLGLWKLTEIALWIYHHVSVGVAW